MLYKFLADLVLVVHALFIAFVVLGGLLVLWRRRIAWLHLAAVAWGAWVMFTGSICPLTPLENSLRIAAGQEGYAGGFIEHYLVSAIYPEGLTRAAQITLGVLLVSLNTAVYAWAVRAWRHRR